jgi:hypothetical protein
VQRRRALVVHRDVLAGVRQRRPDDVLKARGLRGRGHRPGLGLLPLDGVVLPERGDEEGAVRALQCRGQAGLVVEVRGHDLGAAVGQCLGGVGVRPPGERAEGEPPGRVVKDGTRQATTLLTGGAHYGDDLLVGHRDQLPVWSATGGSGHAPRKQPRH